MRIQWIASILWIAACVGVEHPVAREALHQGPSCLVTTVGGDVQGADNGASCTFLGVPFAAPPIDALRWTPPQTVAPWSPSVLPATTPPPTCPTIFTGSPAGSEDCLKLNLWVSDPPPHSRRRSSCGSTPAVSRRPPPISPRTTGGGWPREQGVSSSPQTTVMVRSGSWRTRRSRVRIRRIPRPATTGCWIRGRRSNGCGTTSRTSAAIRGT